MAALLPLLLLLSEGQGQQEEAPAVTFPWIKTVHIVSMTHVDVGGCEWPLF